MKVFLLLPQALLSFSLSFRETLSSRPDHKLLTGEGVLLFILTQRLRPHPKFCTLSSQRICSLGSEEWQSVLPLQDTALLARLPGPPLPHRGNYSNIIKASHWARDPLLASTISLDRDTVQSPTCIAGARGPGREKKKASFPGDYPGSPCKVGL